MQSHIVENITVTGTAASPQTILFSALTDKDGVTLGAFTAVPYVWIVARSLDVDVRIPETPGLSSFKVARSDYGELDGTLTITVAIIGSLVISGAPGLVWTAQKMVDQIGMYIPDEQQELYPPGIRQDWLNAAQQRVVRGLPWHLLGTLQTKDSALALSSGAFAFTSLAESIFEKAAGLKAVRITGGKFARKISFEEYQGTVKYDKSFSADRPVYYIVGGNVNLLGYGTDDTVDVYYARYPQMISLADSVDSELSATLQEIVLEFAMATCFRYMRDLQRSRESLESAALLMQEYLALNPPTDSVEFNEEYDLFQNSESGVDDQFIINVTRT